jgi:hypothetical protein
MTASLDFLTVMVTAALIVTTIAPVALILLFLRDRARGELW